MKGRVRPGPSGPPGDEVTGPGRASKVEKLMKMASRGSPPTGKMSSGPLAAPSPPEDGPFRAFSGAAAGGGGSVRTDRPILPPLRLPPPGPNGAPIHRGKGRPLVPSCRNRRGILLDRGLHPRSGGYRALAGGARSAEVARRPETISMRTIDQDANPLT
jgi:hypothetical protein